MTLDEAIACVDIMGWYLNAWVFEDGRGVDRDLHEAEVREKLAQESDSLALYIDVWTSKEETEFIRNSRAKPYEKAVEDFIEWVEGGMNHEDF